MKRTILALALLAACSKSAPEADNGPDPVATITTATAEAGGAAETVTAYGAAEAGAGGERVLAAPVESTLTAVLAAPGTAVTQGQAIATLTPGPTAQVDLAKANTDAAAATATLARARRLRADGLMSDADVETARAAAATARTTRASLAARQARLTLRAPVAGTVSVVANAPGDLVAAGTAVVRVTAKGDLRARFGVEPGLLQRLRLGGPATVRVGGSGTSTGTGTAPAAPTRIAAIDPQVDAQTRLASVFTSMPPGVRAGTGEPLVGIFTLGGNPGGVTIPYAALADDAGETLVYVIEGGVAHRRKVAVGATVGDRVAIVRGLAVGERVATQGLTGLEDGLKVRVAAAPAAAIQ